MKRTVSFIVEQSVDLEVEADTEEEIDQEVEKLFKTAYEILKVNPDFWYSERALVWNEDLTDYTTIE